MRNNRALFAAENADSSRTKDDDEDENESKLRNLGKSVRQPKIPNVNRKLTLLRRREPAGCLEPVSDMRDNSVDAAVRDINDQFRKE